MRRTIMATLAIVIGAGAVVLAGTAIFDLVWYSRFQVPGISMEPTIHAGGEIWTRPVSPGELRTGQIVVLHPPASAGLEATSVVTRIVAVAGQRVDITGTTLLVDGRASGSAQPFPGISPAVIVPPSTVYVLGDNRLQALGSNDYGPVPVGNVYRRVVDTNGSTTTTLLLRAAIGLVIAGLVVLMWRRRHRRQAQPPGPTADHGPRPLWDT